MTSIRSRAAAIALTGAVAALGVAPGLAAAAPAGGCQDHTFLCAVVGGSDSPADMVARPPHWPGRGDGSFVQV